MTLAHAFGWSWDEYAWVLGAPVAVLAVLVLVVVNRTRPDEDTGEGGDRATGTDTGTDRGTDAGVRAD